MVKPWKDVDALSPVNVGLLATMDSNPYFIPCTPKAILALLQHYDIPIAGKKVCIVGRSAIVGMPLFHLLQRHNATVTVCHSKTEDLPALLSHAEIVVVAIGQPQFIRAEWIKPGATVIDVGINDVENGTNRRVCGDVDFDHVKNVAGAISPVPGGVGPLTVAMLAQNVFEAFKLTQAM
jgi:methylenetetrahydrofolate dehydrogenase (NADP+)/methenyltetrahydrofolate cyclohydrolase/formyltetrahydrofolate synthetase